MYRCYLASLERQDYLPAIQSGLEFIAFGTFVNSTTRIYLKPNLTYPEYKPGVMTNPLMIEAVIQAIRAYTPHIWIGDSDSGGYNRFSMEAVYHATGINELCKKYGVKLVNLSNLPCKPIKINYQKKQFSLNLPVLLTDEMDFLVTLPVPKIHCNTGVSLSFKNQWGCIPENHDRLRLHPYFKHVVLEVNKAVKSRVAIFDGMFGLNHNGPMRGTPVKLNWLMVSDNLGAAARVACDLMQIRLKSINHLRYAEKIGFVPNSEDIILSQDIESFKKDRFYLKRQLTDLPGYIAFNSPLVAYLAYFSPLAGILHKLLYLVRDPLYDYEKHKVSKN